MTSWEHRRRTSLLRLLPADWSFVGKRVLDFGSGAGRTLRHFATEAETAEFWGADIDEPSIAWMQENLSPPFHAWQSTINPPLGLEHGSFDLIYAISVFTHLTDNSIQWLLELHRLLKPDGLLIATFMGRWNSEWFAKEPWVEDRVGMNVLASQSRLGQRRPGGVDVGVVGARALGPRVRNRGHRTAVPQLQLVCHAQARGRTHD